MSKKTDYFGGFFWVAVVSFTVPFFVGWKAFQNLQPYEKPKPVFDASGVDHNLWDYLLKSYVSEGLVDYDGMKKDHLFYEYLREIGQCNPDALETEDEKLALACNAYNALVIHGVIKHKISDSVMNHQYGDVGFFEVVEHLYAGQTVSLNDIEHKMIRPVFKEPRVHVALVCGARSCPAIRPEAYVGDRIQDQLHDQSCQFANSSKHVEYDAESGKLNLSAILDWYGYDFNERYPKGTYLDWIKELTEPELAKAKAIQALHTAIDGVIADASEKLKEQMKDPEFEGTIAEAIEGLSDKVSFFEYDWSLNSQKKTSGGVKAAKAGSGSIPNS